MLPDLSGFELARVLRHGGKTPIIILSARGEKADKLHGPSPRRRRLHHQAVRHGRAGGAHQHRAAQDEADGRDHPAGRPSRSISEAGPPPALEAICTSPIANSRFCGCWPSAARASCFAMSSSGKSGAFSTPARPARSIARCRGCGRKSKRIRERPVFCARSTATATS